MNSNNIKARDLKTFAEINILLNKYDDIFSDFDLNPYADRTLSDDFISQAKKMAKHKKANKIILHFFVPLNKRNEADEEIIINRLGTYFSAIHNQLTIDIKKTTIKGLLLSLLGISLMLAASYLSFIKTQVYYAHLLLVFFEPAGWFLLWAGLDNLVYDSKNDKKELSFYTKMISAKIEFSTLKNDTEKQNFTTKTKWNY